MKSSSKSSKDQSTTQNGSAAAQQQQQQHMNTLTNQKKTSVMMPMHPNMHAPQPPHMHPHHIQQQQMMAAVAAHAVSQQQQQQHHPMHHHHVQHAAAAQQMWQTRSYESGIGIYHNHNATTTAATAATTATTNFNTDNLQHLQQQQQHQQHLQQQQLHTASNHYYPSTNASSNSFYNYLAPSNYQEHLLLAATPLHQQQQLVHNSINSSSTSTSSPLTTSPLSNSSNLLPSNQALPIGHPLTNANPIAPTTSTSIQLSTNLTFNTNNNNNNSSNNNSPPTIDINKTNHENIYGQTRNLNFKQVNAAPPPVPPHSSQHYHHNHQLPIHNQTPVKSGSQHHHHHRHHSHSHSQHCRSHHQGSSSSYNNCSMFNCSHPPVRFKSHDPIYDNFGERPTKHVRPSRRSSSITATSTQIADNCNCVSCYTLAPLFGAPTPKRPPRSLSQQQLRQHQRLSGAKNLFSKDMKKGVVKWCSDSDVSLLGREDQEQSEGTDDYRPMAYKNRKPYYFDDSYNYDDFNLDQDFDIDNFNLTQMDYKKQLEKPLKPQATKFNAYAARHQHPAEKQKALTDGYVDKVRLRQIRSPTPKRKESLQTKDPKTHSNEQKKSPTNLLAMRRKSQSTESFFEQPQEEGTLYLYGGRKRITKTPSTTNIYDRVKNQVDLIQKQQLLQSKQYNSQLNLNEEKRKFKQKSSDKSYDHDTLKPLIPPPLWRGAKRMNLKSLGSNPKLNNSKILDQNNNYITFNKTETKSNNQTRLEESNQTNINQKAVTTNNSKNSKLTGLYSSDKQQQPQQIDNNDLTSKSKQQQSHMDSLQQHQQQQQTQYRMGRSSSRIDHSDMESIYGYLKPRKPRSLSMKKIHILDY